MLNVRLSVTALLSVVLALPFAAQADVVEELSLMAEKAIDARDGGALPAFPGAEGFGATSVGGRGGQVIKVTNLNATGPGSLQAACKAEGPRIVVFEVSGVIQGDILITEPNIYIAGQTAPGAGITIEGMLKSLYNPTPRLHDITVRFLRVRPPGPRGAGGDCLQLVRINRLIVDHVSCSWGSDENFDCIHSKNVTVQWCAVEESDPVRHGGEEPGGHNFGMIVGYLSKNVTMHHNLFAHHRRRAPLSGAEVLDHRNNVIYNMETGLCFHPVSMNLQRPDEPFATNLAANYFKLGPDDPKDWTTGEYITPMIEHSGRTRMWLADNFFEWVHDGQVADYETADGIPDLWLAPRRLGFTNGGPLQPPPTPWPAAPVRTTGPEAAYEAVMAHTGCLPRDAVSKRTVQEVKTGTGSWGRHDPDGGLMEGLTPGTPPTDTDDDGMPDDWETAHGLDPADPEDRNHIVPAGASPGDRHKDYTYIEYYVNSLADAFVAQAATEAELNRPPEVRIVTPENGIFVPVGKSVRIRAEASDPDGEVVRVALFDGDTQLAAANAPSCEHTAGNLKPGLHSLSARATDDRGATAVYQPVSVIVALPGDANLDGHVNIGDFGVLRLNYGETDATWLQGDFNSDGQVNLADFGVLRAYYGEEVDTGGDGDAATADATSAGGGDPASATEGGKVAGNAPRLTETQPAPGRPLSGKRQLSLTFDRHVVVGADAVEVHATQTGEVAAPETRYEPGARTLHLTWPQTLPDDGYEVRVWADSIVGDEGGASLDGEVDDPLDAASLPSGDGTPGGDARLRYPAP
jgi:hypothetical protein